MLVEVWNILVNVGTWILSFSEELKNIAEILVIIIGGVLAIKGVKYFKALREKRERAIFGFWMQFSLRLKAIHKRLSGNPSIINNFYSEKIRTGWTNVGAPTSDSILNDFIQHVSDTLQLMKSVPDQLPAYEGWVDDYTKVFNFLDDVLYFDIKDSSSRFKFIENATVENRNEYCKDICHTINTLLYHIQQEQKLLEPDICKSQKYH